MSGPWDCLICLGAGLVTVIEADREIVEPCETCRGTGERWLFMTDPPKPEKPQCPG